jgi:hypothetical protein
MCERSPPLNWRNDQPELCCTKGPWLSSVGDSPMRRAHERWRRMSVDLASRRRSISPDALPNATRQHIQRS